MTEQQEQKLMTKIIKLAKDGGQRDKLGKIILYTFNEDMLRDFALDIFDEINGIIRTETSKS